MTPNHPAYKIMDMEKPWADDLPGDGDDQVKNKFINRAFPWIFHQVVFDAHGAMSWLMPDASFEVQEAVDKLCNTKIPDESDEEVHLIGPSLLATLSWAVMCTPWYTFLKMRNKPPHEVWYKELLTHYSKFKRGAVNQRIGQSLKLFYERFPEARRLEARRKSSIPLVDTPAMVARDGSISPPPDCD